MENLAHTNQNIPSNLYWANIWCIFLKEQSQCPWISFTIPTELKSSSPLYSFWALDFDVNDVFNLEQAWFWKHGKKLSFHTISVYQRNAVKTEFSLKFIKNIRYTPLNIFIFPYTRLYTSHKRFRKCIIKKMPFIFWKTKKVIFCQAPTKAAVNSFKTTHSF